MAVCGSTHAAFLFLSSFLLQCSSSHVYVIYMGSKNGETQDEAMCHHQQILSTVHGGSLEMALESHVYSYSKAFRGFAAKLSDEQAVEIANMPGVVSVFPNTKRSLHTTHSWDFMGLSADEASEIPGYSTKNQENIIIGFIDTGIWPESSSFADTGMPEVPLRWKGQCQTGEAFNKSSCNKKVIGARYYYSGYEEEERSIGDSLDSNKIVMLKSPRDSSGHGTHTASIAAGRVVKDMNYNGLASGVGRGGVPMSRIAVYKTCWDLGCYDADLLAAFDDAIKDGVDILSVSLGPDSPQFDYFIDAISIGSFHAAAHGIPVVSSAGNSGTRGSATNLAPWLLTVSASSTDRDFASYIAIHNRTRIKGSSLCTLKMNRSATPISAAEANKPNFLPFQSSFCLGSSLSKRKSKGKILVCLHSGSSSESRVEKSLEVKRAGGAGMILIDEAESDVAIPFVVPASSVGRASGEMILSYANHTRKPKLMILPSRNVLESHASPKIAAFSSKGPNSLNPEILKPDITAPGLNIIAAWSPAAIGKMSYNVLSGTSMSCPHITGLVALIKAVYPSWSPSAIKSAIMTTAIVVGKNGKPITADAEGRVANPFDLGSGFPRPSRILDPGLVYDAQTSDYKDFLCSIGYDDKKLQLVTGDNSACNHDHPQISAPSNLNYPSIAVPGLKRKSSVTRTVTNVGKPRSVYRAVILQPRGVNVSVVPDTLVFRNHGQKLSFTVHFDVVTPPSQDYVFGALTWMTGKIHVRSPLVVRVASSHTGS